MIPEGKEWFAVIGCKDGRIEVMTGVDYRANPVNLKECIWLQAVDKSEAIPNAATAVYRATLGQVPTISISQLLRERLHSEGWSVYNGDVEMIETIDRFLSEDCGVDSVFGGMKKVEDEDNCGSTSWEEA